MGSLVSGLSIRNISSHPINEPKTNGFSFNIKPDCVVSCKGVGVDEGAIDLASVEFFIEFKLSNDQDPFNFSRKQLEKCKENPTLPLNQSSAAQETLGQIGTYVALQMEAQYRTHTFFVLIIGSYARLMRCDRSGIIFTDPIYYNSQPELVVFFERYNAASLAVRGSDTTVAQPSKDELSAAKAYPELHAPLLAVSIENEDPEKPPNRYIINSPLARPSLPVGRSTRTSIAFDVQEKKLVFMKDSWPVFMHDKMMEGRVYQRLNEQKVRNTPHCVDFSDGGRNYETRTQRFAREPWSQVDVTMPVRRHHRLILDTVGKPLGEFSSSKELVRAVCAALIGMGLEEIAFC